jgi:hypothetical protein
MVRQVSRAAVATVVALVATIASSSCNAFNLPDGACHGVVVQGATAPETRNACSSCLDKGCCDAVGACEAEGAGCSKAIVDGHGEILAAGLDATQKEAEVRRRFSTAAQRNTYECMRRECSGPCALPVCEVDRAASLIVNATCDRCLSDSCCSAINACYQDRPCRLALDCITNECATDFGPSVGRIDPARLPELERLICDRSEAPPGTEDGGPPSGAEGMGSCVTRCIFEYAISDERPERTQVSTCLAYRFYACGVRAGCAEACTFATDASAEGG